LAYADVDTKRESLPSIHDKNTTKIETQFHKDIKEQHT
jgi:hypothetical protein